MGSLAIRLDIEPVRSIDFGSIGAAYTGIGTAMTRPIRMFFLQNLTDVDLFFSLNGIDDHFPLPANGYLLLDITSNKTIPQGFFLAEGQRVYVKELGVPTNGTVYLTTFFGADL